MDSHPLFPDGTPSSSASFADARSTAPGMPNALYVSAESCTRDSPDLSFTTRFDSASSSLESNGCFRSSPTIEGSSTIRSKNEDDPWSMMHGTRELETVLVDPKGEVKKEKSPESFPLGTDPSLQGSRPDWPQGRPSDEFTTASREELLDHDVPPESLKKLLITNTNTTPFVTRFSETLDYYAAMFESVDGTMSRHQRERINMERHCLARDIVNIIACEGKERVERHELLGKWKSRFAMAGFRQYPLSAYVNSVIRRLLGGYSPHYKLVERDGAMLLGWKDRFLVSASAWR